MSSSYRELGASSSKTGVHSALAAAGLKDSAMYFASVFPDPAGDSRYRAFLHCDGAGTKSIIAYVLARETGDPRWYRSLAQDAVVMNLDDVYCLGPVEGLMLSNLVARNGRLVSDDALQALYEGYSHVAARLRTAGIELTLSGGETADCGDVVRTLVVDAVMSGRILADRLIAPQSIATGDVIVGLSSTGQAAYEDEPNSGISSNGLTLARHALLAASTAERYPEVADPGIASDKRYRGCYSVLDSVAALGTTVGAALLSPTRTYAPILHALYADPSVEIHGVIHNTGGGQTKVLRFGSRLRCVKDRLFAVPPLFSLIQDSGGVPWREMYEVFNMGHRMELYVPPASAETVIGHCSRFGVEAHVVGRVEQASDRNEVVLETPAGTFSYSLDH